MADDPSSKDNENNQPAAEVLQPKTDEASKPEGEGDKPVDSKDAKAADAKAAATKARRGVYKPSHKATFIGAAVVIAIIAVNAGILVFLVKKQAAQQTQLAQGSVTVNQDALDKLGVNRTSVGDAGVQLTINPDTKFGGKVEIAKDITIGGKLQLNGAFTATDGSFAKLQGGETALSKLNVNGDTTVSNLNVRQQLDVLGTSRFQGPVTLTQLVTANNLNIANNLSVGGVLSANNFHTASLTVDSIIYLGGHIVTQGLVPSAVGGNALGSNGTIAISGSDFAGTVSANIGLGATAGTIATVTFRTKYSSTPRVVITPVGNAFGSVYVNRNATGFSIVVSSAAPPGGYAFDYIVVQ